MAEATADRLLLRMDDYTWRLDVRGGERNAMTVVGWDVGTQEALETFSKLLSDEGYHVTDGSPELAAEREVTALITFRDPDDLYDIELFCGKKKSTARFVSPLGATFVSGDLGVGHIAQAVTDGARYHRLYHDIFGFRISDHITAHGGQAELEFLHCNPRHHSFAFIEVIEGVTPPPGVAHLMLEVTEMDIVGRSYDKVLAGAARLRSTLGRHTNDRMTSWYASSPSGFGIEYGCGGIVIDDETWLATRYDDADFWGHVRQPQPR
uniref:VOC family protein n=1 Tax=Nocardioides sp. GXZ039 TaxID=3136018 RepID=UPI0030F3E63F